MPLGQMLDLHELFSQDSISAFSRTILKVSIISILLSIYIYSAWYFASLAYSHLELVISWITSNLNSRNTEECDNQTLDTNVADAIENDVARKEEETGVDEKKQNNNCIVEKNEEEKVDNQCEDTIKERIEGIQNQNVETGDKSPRESSLSVTSNDVLRLQSAMIETRDLLSDRTNKLLHVMMESTINMVNLALRKLPEIEERIQSWEEEEKRGHELAQKLQGEIEEIKRRIKLLKMKITAR